MRCGCNCNLTLLCRHLLWFLFCEAMIVSSRFVAVRAASTWKLRRDGRQAEGGGWLILPALFVLTDFLANEGDDFHRHGRSTRWMTTLPAPVQPKSTSMPGDHRFRFDDHQGRSPATPEL